MNDVLKNPEEETEGLGLGLGLNALFDEVEDHISPENEKIIENINSALSDENFHSTSDEIDDTPKATQLSAPNDNVVSDTRKRTSVPIENLYPSRFQPRRIFEQEAIDELSSSIKQYGVLQPLLVREDPDNAGHFEIIAGERRWRASQEAQLHELPVIVLELNELDAYKIALIENLQREDLDPIDEANGYRHLLEEFGQTQDELAKAVGKSRPHITNMVRLLNLPDTVQAHLSAGDLSMGHARALITAKDPESLAKQVIAKGLSVRQTEKFAAEKKGVEQKKRPKATSSVPAPSEKDADTVALETDMSNALGMRVSIDSVDGKSGKLAIEFKSLDQLDELLHRLAHFPGSRLNG